MVGAVGLSEALNDRFVGRWSHGHGLFGETQEQFSSAARISSIEAEGELVQVVIQMLPAYGTLVRAQKPSLQQRCHQMNSRQQLRRRFLLSL